MGEIINITNFNAYCGRYRSNQMPAEKKPDWTLEDLFISILPVLALRNMNPDDDWPLVWRRNSYLTLAIEVSLVSLKRWQAFRPVKSVKIIPKLTNVLPKKIVEFQNKMLNLKAFSTRDITKMKPYVYNDVLITMSKIVAEICSCKNCLNPMLGSKVMHFFFPEFFPVWDTAWIKTALDKEDLGAERLANWFPKEIKVQLSNHSEAAVKYATYLGLMLKDLDRTPQKEYKKIKEAYCKCSKINFEIIDYHCRDIVSILFEVCLLGKHIR